MHGSVVYAGALLQVRGSPLRLRTRGLLLRRLASNRELSSAWGRCRLVVVGKSVLLYHGRRARSGVGISHILHAAIPGMEHV